ncbi:MAG: hypothetical protein AAB540_03085 [Patescibacteria group bacterium]
MAKMTSEQLARKRDEFEQAQMKGYEDLYNAEPVDAVPLDAVPQPADAVPPVIGAESGGVAFDFDANISEEIKAAVVGVMPKHEELFEQALATEKKRGTAPEAAFKLAFEAVYGGVLFADVESRMADPNDPIIKKLSGEGILKTALVKSKKDATGKEVQEVHLKGRHELVAALRRLRAASKNPQEQGALLTKAFPGTISGKDLKDMEEKHETTTDKEKKLKEVRKYFSDSKNGQALEESHTALCKLLGGSTIANVSNFNVEIRELTNSIDSKKDERKSIATPSEEDIRKELNIRGRNSQQPFDRNAERKKFLEGISNSRNSLNIAKDEGKLKELEIIKRVAINFREQMLVAVENLRTAGKYDVKSDALNGVALDTAVSKLKAIDPDSNTFNPSELTRYYTDHKLGDFFKKGQTASDFLDQFNGQLAVAEEGVKTAKKVLDENQKMREKATNLTDEQAAKKIVAALVGEQFPDMSVEDRGKLATMILTEDVMRLQQTGSYEDIAKEGSAELLETVNHAGVKAKLIGFRYKVGEKTEQPFKGLKPSDFENWTKISKLFEIGRLNHKNGFFVMAAFEAFGKDAHVDVRSIQSLQVERKLKALLAEKMGVKDKMGDSRVAKIVGEAFDEQMEMVRPLVKAYFEHYNLNSAKWDENKIKELNIKMARLREEFKLGKIPQDTFERRKEKLLKEAKEAGVQDKVEFSEDSIMTDWWESPDSAWLRDAGSDTAEWGKAKAKGLGKGALGIAWGGVAGATKLGLNVGLQTALLPLRLAKYPLLAVAKPLVGIINLFRRSKWVPLPGIRDSIRNDFGRALSYAKGTTVNTAKGAYNTVTAVPKSEWEKAKGKEKPYKDRTKVNLDHLAEEAKEYGEKATATPIETSNSPFIELAPWIEKIKALGIEARAGSEHSEKKKDDEHGQKKAA